MGLKAIYCKDVLEPTMAKPGASASASSDFSGKDIIGYATVLAAIMTVSGCISQTVTETKPEVQHSASGEEKSTPTVTTTTPVTNHDTTTTTTTASTVAAYDPATFEVPKEQGWLPTVQTDHLFATPGDAVGVKAIRHEGGLGQIDFWVVYEGINKVDGETVKASGAEDGAAKTIDVPRYVANFDIWGYSRVSKTVVGPIHSTLEADLLEYDKHVKDVDGFEGHTGVRLTLNAIYSGNNGDMAATCKFIKPLDEDAQDINPNDGKLDGCVVTDGKTMEYFLRSISMDEKTRTMRKYDSENPQGYAIVSIAGILTVDGGAVHS